jgi:hypothetical protein
MPATPQASIRQRAQFVQLATSVQPQDQVHICALLVPTKPSKERPIAIAALQAITVHQFKQQL